MSKIRITMNEEQAAELSTVSRLGNDTCCLYQLLEDILTKNYAYITNAVEHRETGIKVERIEE